MTENTQPDPSGWTAPTREQALAAVRDILRYNPERWSQDWWLSNEFDGGLPGELFDRRRNGTVVTTGELAQYATEPLPDEPENPELPLCGTKGCVAGWLAIVASPPGSAIANSAILRLPGGGIRSIPWQAAEIAGLSEKQAYWLFSGGRLDADEIVEALDRLIADREAAIWQSPQS